MVQNLILPSIFMLTYTLCFVAFALGFVLIAALEFLQGVLSDLLLFFKPPLVQKGRKEGLLLIPLVVVLCTTCNKIT